MTDSRQDASDIAPGAKARAFEELMCLFDRARELPSGERSMVLDEACARNPSLRQSVEDLLRADEAEGPLEDDQIDSIASAACACIHGSQERDSTLDSSASLAPGVAERVGKYEIEGEIARGGMGVVFRARDAELRRTVALKMLLAGSLASERERRRFEIEACAAARLDHPAIVPVYDVGEAGGRSFLVMRLLEGGSLAEVQARYRGRYGEAATLLETLARAIEYAHSHGILHRDLKPANVLFDIEGRPYITDFGIARSLESTGSLATTGIAVGTLSYMAPEQVAGRPGAATSPLLDVYGLGAILYELLTGRPPFDSRSTPECLQQILHDEPISPSRLDPGVPRDLATIAMTALERNPRRRYPSALAMAEELRRFQEGQPIRARPVTRIERARRWALRRPAEAALVALLVLLAVAVPVAGIVYSTELARRSERLAFRERASDARRLEHAFDLWRDGWFGRARAIVEDLSDDHAVRRDFAWRLLSAALSIEKPVLRPGFGDFGKAGLAFDATASHLITASAYGRFAVVDVKTGRHGPAIERPQELVLHQTFSAGGDTVARVLRASSSGETAVEVLRFVRNGEKHDAGNIARFAAPEAVLASLSRDGAYLVVSTASPPLSELRHVSTRGNPIRYQNQSIARAVAWSEDGDRIGIVERNGRAVLLDREEFSPIGAANLGPEGSVLLAAFSAALDRLVVVRPTSRIEWLDTTDWSIENEILIGRGSIVAGALSPAGDLLALSRGIPYPVVELWDLEHGRLQRSLKRDSAPVVQLAFAMDGSMLATGTSTADVRVVELNRSAFPLRFVRGEGRYEWVGAGPDGDSIIAARRKFEVERFRVVAEGSRMSLVRDGVIRSPAGIQPRKALSPNGERAALGFSDGRLELRYLDWNGDRSGARTEHVVDDLDSPLAGVAFAGDSRTFVALTRSGDLRVWRLENESSHGPTWRRLSSLKAIACHSAELAVTNGGVHVAIADRKGTSIDVWNTARAKRLARRVGEPGDHTWTMTFDSRGRYLATSGPWRAVRLWALEDLELDSDAAPRVELVGHSDTVSALAFPPDGESLVSASTDGNVRVWDIVSGQAKAILFGHRYQAKALAIPSSGDRLVSVGGLSKDEYGEVLVWMASP